MGDWRRAAATGITASILAAGLGIAAPDAGATVTPNGATANGATGNTARAPQGVRAPYAELADADTGTGLWARSPTTDVPIGSIAKVMTAYVVLQEGNLDRLITVPKGVTGYVRHNGASSAGLKPGEKLTARQLLYAMLIPSGCDAAYTLAAAYGPGLPAFVEKMNAAAARLGLTRTFFTDVSGLPDPAGKSSYSDASDLVSLGRDAMALPQFASIVRLPGYRLRAEPGLHPSFHWRTTNPLLSGHPDVTGIKTGNTDPAGFCLLFEASRNGRTLIGVVLDDRSFKVVASDSEKMMNWGWSGSPADRPLGF